MERVLLLMRAESFAQVRETVAEAYRTASVPSRLTVGLLLSHAPEEDELTAMKAMRGLMYLVSGENLWKLVRQFWQGEAYVLILSPQAVFSPSWDRALQEMLQKTGSHSVLTGILPWPGDPVDAVYAIAAEKMEGRKLFLRQGVALRYALDAHLSAFINPEFAFGPVPFFMKTDRDAGPLFLQAFENRWVLETMPQPVLHMKTETQLDAVEVPEGDAAKRFAQHFGMDLETGALSCELREGIFTPDLQVKASVPLSVKIQEGIRQGTIGRDGPDPLFVTAFLPEDEEALPDELEMAHFRRMAKIERLPLLCFALPGAIRRILFSHPNTLEYRPRFSLPLQGLDVQDRAAYDVLNRFFVLAAGKEKSEGHSHYVWTDFDYLRYSVYEGAAMNYGSICTDRICLGRVQGKPDFSMIAVPQELVEPVCREIRVICEAERLHTARLPAPEDVLEELMAKNPDWFELPDLPGDHDLFSLCMTLWGEEWGRR